MKKIFLLFAVMFFFNNISFAQFSLEKFWQIELGKTVADVKKIFPNEKWEERVREDNKSFFYYGWIEPNSIRVGFTFSKEGELRYKSLSNSKRDEENAIKVFDQLKNIALKKFGNGYEQKEFFGITALIWKNENDIVIALTLRGERASLVVTKGSGLPFL